MTANDSLTTAADLGQGTTWQARVGDTHVLVTCTTGGVLAATKPAHDPHARWSPPVAMQRDRDLTIVALDPEPTWPTGDGAVVEATCRRGHTCTWSRSTCWGEPWWRCTRHGLLMAATGAMTGVSLHAVHYEGRRP